MAGRSAAAEVHRKLIRFNVPVGPAVELTRMTGLPSASALKTQSHQLTAGGVIKMNPATTRHPGRAWTAEDGGRMLALRCVDRADTTYGASSLHLFSYPELGFVLSVASSEQL